MIVSSLLRYFSGTIRFEVVNGFAERLINLCAAHNVSLWCFEKTPQGFAANVTAKSYKTLKKLAKKSNVEVCVIFRKGFVFKAGRYKSRWGLVIGIALFFGALIGMQNVVWSIEVKGNSQVKTEVILSELSCLGVKKLALIPTLDLQQKRQEALLNMPQLAWMAINRDGCKLSVQVSERRMKPEIEEKTPCDVVATKTGLILYMEVYSGRRLVTEKHTVQAGDTIVSGLINPPPTEEGAVQRGKPQQVHADAKVIAQVQAQKSISLDIEQLSKAYTGERKTRRFLSAFSLRLPLFVASKIGGDYDVTSTEEPFLLFGIKTPFSIYSLHYSFYEKKSENLSMQDARGVLEKFFLQYEATELQNSVIISKIPTEQLKDGVLTITKNYVLEENIAKKVSIPIITE